MDPIVNLKVHAFLSSINPQLRAEALEVLKNSGGLCACGKPGELMFDPYDADVHQTKTPVVYCPECEQRSCDDI